MASADTVARPAVPAGLAPIGCRLAAELWRAHRPDPLGDKPTCARCGEPAPCRTARFADDFLASVHDGGHARHRRRPTPIPPLPRRHTVDMAKAAVVRRG